MSGSMADDGEGQVSGSRGIMSETSRPIADVDIADVIRALTAAGAATVPGILGDEARRHLLEEARAFPFISAPAVVGPYGSGSATRRWRHSHRAAPSRRFRKPS